MRRPAVVPTARLSLLAALVLALAAAAATGGGAATGPNLLQNGDAEAGPAATDSSGVSETIPGWIRAGSFTTVAYDSPGGFPTASVATEVGGGKSFFAGGPANPDSRATQTVKVGSRAALIDRRALSATLSGHLGGFSGQRDSLTATASFLSAAGKTLGTLRIGPVTPAERKSLTTLVAKAATAKVPPKTRAIRVVLAAVRTDGSYNDGYADNLRLTLARR